MEQIIIKGKRFQKYIDEQQIKKIIDSVVQKINKDYKDKELICIVVLNGAFMFAADLFKHLEGLPKISFVKFSSYKGDKNSGEITKLIGLNENIENKDVLIIEDIVDSGATMAKMRQDLLKLKPKSLEIASLIFKPSNFKGNYKVKYVGKEISEEFIVGYGFDFDGYGRNLKDIYQAVK